MKDNIPRKLTDLLVPESVREEIVQDIFGSHHDGMIYTMGLLDASDEEDFNQHLLMLKER